jgi:exodeoxyribonuclease V alpha subunit
MSTLPFFPTPIWAGALEGAPEDAPTTLPLTALDLALAGFLTESQPSVDPRHGLLAALTSHQYGRGHACLDLQLLTRHGVVALGWDARLQDLLPMGLSEAAASLPWAQGASSPLVLDGSRLYLRRNWQAEQAIRASIVARLAQPVQDSASQGTVPSAAHRVTNATTNTGAEPSALRAALDSLFGKLPDHKGGMGVLAANGLEKQTPDWQKVACALAARGRFTLITGGPGTGKTTTVVRLLGLLQSQAVQSGKPLRIALAAPTGKAAARLGESIAQALQKLPLHMQAHIPVQAQTLHKLLQVRAATQANAAPALALDLVVVDEASMIDLELMARLLASVPLSANLILLGDKDQLASVEAGAVMGQLCAGAEQGGYSADTISWVQAQTGSDVGAWAGRGSDLAQQTVMLRVSRRFAADSVIGQWATAVNTGDRQAVAGHWADTPLWQAGHSDSVTRLQPAQAFDAQLAALVRHGWRAWLQQLQLLAGQDSSFFQAVPTPPPFTAAAQPQDHQASSGAGSAMQGTCGEAQALALLAAYGQFQVLCAVREGPWGVTALNRAISRALGFAPEGWYAGRPVMVTRNDYHLNLMNGDVGLCLPTAQGLRVAFAQGASLRWVLPSRLDAVETVFAMTVHKSQGSEFDHVALVLPDRIAPVLTRELLYTGITRAKHRLTLVVPQAGVLRQAAAARILRSGGLGFDGV